MHFVVRGNVDPLTLVRTDSRGDPLLRSNGACRRGPATRRRLRGVDGDEPRRDDAARSALRCSACSSARSGIYGVISYSVGQRTRELGIRTALGAIERRITVMIVGEGLRTAGIGIAIGIVTSRFVAARVARDDCCSR